MFFIKISVVVTFLCKLYCGITQILPLKDANKYSIACLLFEMVKLLQLDSFFLLENVMEMFNLEYLNDLAASKLLLNETTLVLKMLFQIVLCLAGSAWYKLRFSEINLLLLHASLALWFFYSMFKRYPFRTEQLLAIMIDKYFQNFKNTCFCTCGICRKFSVEYLADWESP